LVALDTLVDTLVAVDDAVKQERYYIGTTIAGFLNVVELLMQIDIRMLHPFVEPVLVEFVRYQKAATSFDASILSRNIVFRAPPVAQYNTLACLA
jgi:hypothetical protein